MSVLFAPQSGGAGGTARSSGWIRRIRLPLEAWSGRRRLLAGGVIAALVFGAGANAWISADLTAVQASRTNLAQAQQRIAEAKQSLARLPELRRHVVALPAGQPPEPWTPADDVRLLSLLAARSGITVLTLTPGAGNGAGLDAVRPIHLGAQGDFLHLMVFLRGLSDLPVLVVPADVTVKRSAGGLLINATLHVFNALSPVSGSPETVVDDDMGADDEELIFYDPFSYQRLAGGDAASAGLLRLVGLLRDRTHGLALLETTDGATTVERGQSVGDHRLTGMDALSITLTNRVGAYTLTLTEAS
jgi:Tfp pilus assembly protein PilO